MRVPSALHLVTKPLRPRNAPTNTAEGVPGTPEGMIVSELTGCRTAREEVQVAPPSLLEKTLEAPAYNTSGFDGSAATNPVLAVRPVTFHVAPPSTLRYTPSLVAAYTPVAVTAK